MARIRSIKPSFFRNEELAELSFATRLFFVGLWGEADREGRLEDRPRRLKAAIFPYDSDESLGMSIEQMIDELAARGFVQRYEVSGQRYVMVPNFARHQLISRDEAPSEIPGPDGLMTPYERPPNDTVRARIYQRDNFICLYCGRNMAKTVRVRSVDHVIPYTRGGSHRDDNLVTACKVCNAKKGNRTPSEAQMPWPVGFGSYLTGGRHTVNGPGQDEELGFGIEEMDVDGEMEGSADGALFGADGAPPPPQPRAEDFQELWNSTTTAPLPRCRDLTSKRRRHIKARLTERPLTEWRVVIERIQASAFCRGEVTARHGSESPWVASFDWLIGSPDVAVKVLEGKYDDRKPKTKPSEIATGEEWVCHHPSPKCHSRYWCEKVRDQKDAIAKKKAAS